MRANSTASVCCTEQLTWRVWAAVWSVCCRVSPVPLHCPQLAFRLHPVLEGSPTCLGLRPLVNHASPAPLQHLVRRAPPDMSNPAAPRFSIGCSQLNGLQSLPLPGRRPTWGSCLVPVCCVSISGFDAYEGRVTQAVCLDALTCGALLTCVGYPAELVVLTRVVVVASVPARVNNRRVGA